MKKGFWLIAALLVIMCLSSAAVICIATGLFGKKDDESYLSDIDRNNTDRYVSYHVSSGSLKITDNLTGYVEYGDNNIVTFSVDAPYETVKIMADIGNDIHKDDIICETGQAAVKSPVDGRIVNIQIEDKTTYFTIIDYSDLLIRVLISEKYQNKLNGNTEIYGIYNGGQDRLELHSISPYVEEGYFAVYLNNPYKLYNNSSVEVLINYETLDDVVIIPSEYIMKDADGKDYIRIMDANGKISKVYVSVGIISGGCSEIIEGDYLIGKDVIVDKDELSIKDGMNG